MPRLRRMQARPQALGLVTSLLCPAKAFAGGEAWAARMLEFGRFGVWRELPAALEEERAAGLAAVPAVRQALSFPLSLRRRVLVWHAMTSGKVGHFKILPSQNPEY